MSSHSNLSFPAIQHFTSEPPQNGNRTTSNACVATLQGAQRCNGTIRNTCVTAGLPSEERFQLFQKHVPHHSSSIFKLSYLRSCSLQPIHVCFPSDPVFKFQVACLPRGSCQRRKVDPVALIAFLSGFHRLGPHTRHSSAKDSPIFPSSVAALFILISSSNYDGPWSPWSPLSPLSQCQESQRIKIMGCSEIVGDTSCCSCSIPDD